MVHRVYLIFALLFVMLMNLEGMDKSSEKDTEPVTISDSYCYTIGDYQIFPKGKIVKELQMIGGINWDGYTYTPMEDIDFDSTEMYLIGSSILFKEQTKGKDLKKAHFNQVKKYHLNQPTVPLIAFDNDSIYSHQHRSILATINIKDKQILRDDIFEDNEGKLYVLNKYATSLSLALEDSLNIDKASIRHIVDNFYYDNTKVYYLGNYFNKEGDKIISKFGKTLGEYKDKNFHVGKSYLTIDNQVYLRSENNIYPLDLNPSTVQEYSLDSYYMAYLITDGDKVYINSLHYQGTDFTELTALRGLQLEGVLSSARIWKYDDKTKMVYLKDSKDPSLQKMKGWQGLLMYSKTTKKAFIIDIDGKVLNFNGMMISDNKGAFEVLNLVSDTDRLKNIEPTIIFNDVFYSALLKKHKEKGIDADKISRIGENIFQTDGKHLILMTEIERINQTYKEAGVAHIDHYFDNWICRINKPENLQIINNNILTDGTTLYYQDREKRDTKLMAVPLVDFGIPVYYLEQGKDKINTKQTCP